MNHKEKITKLKNAIQNGKRISKQELIAIANKAFEKGQHFDFLVKVNKECYKNWLAKNPKLNADNETTYLTDTNNKMFDKKAGGYSLFAMSIGEMEREDEGYYSQLDRIERCPWDYAIILD